MFSARLKQFASAMAHGGSSRLISVIWERLTQGYSTRSLSYSWPQSVQVVFSENQSVCVHYCVPHLESAATYGGIATILNWAFEDLKQGKNIHFVTFDSGGSLDTFRSAVKCSDQEWDLYKSKVSLQNLSQAKEKKIVANAQDVFVATAWWTKLSLEGQVSPEKLIYLIQDYEPLFYPHVDDPVENQLRALAQKSYDGRYHAMVNSAFLADFLLKHKICQLDKALSWKVFDCWIDTSVFKKDAQRSKKKQIFVYARPEVARNRFDLCVETLKKLSPHLGSGWKVYGLGTLKTSVDLGHGVLLEGKGKLNLQEYAQFLQETPISLCLMESPHPSYPPLEHAACGGIVVCNHYENKNYELLGPEFRSVQLHPIPLSEALIQAVKDFEKT